MLPRTMLNVQGRAFYQLMSFSCAMAFLIFGYDAGVLGGVQTTQPFLSALDITGKEEGDLIIPLVASSYTLGCLVMALFLTFSGFGYHFGRRVSILLGDVLVMIGGALQASSYSIAQIITARIISGFGIGLISATVPTYMSETTIKTVERGPQVAVQCVYLIWGVALAYWVDLGMTQLDSQASWRFPVSLQSFFTLLSFLGMLVLPDTPRWYYSRGRNDDGDRVLAQLFALPTQAEEVQKMRQDILETIKLESLEGRIRWSDWFWDRSELQSARRVRTSFIVLSLQQNMGINVLVYYSTIILANVGLDPFLQQTLAAVANTVFAIGTLFTVPNIERWGRRTIMFWTAVGCGAISMAIFVAMQSISNPTLSTQWTAVAFIIIFQFLTGFGWMGCPWLYGPEIAPLRYRHLGGAAGIVGEWSMTFATVFGGGVAVQRVGWEIWFWQLGSCVVAIIFVYFWCPETAGKTLEEIDDVFVQEVKRWPGADKIRVREKEEDEQSRNSDEDGTVEVEYKV